MPTEYTLLNIERAMTIAIHWMRTREGFVTDNWSLTSVAHNYLPLDISIALIRAGLKSDRE